MRRVLGLENLGEPLPRSAVTIGKFFAVHRGHQALLRATVDAARRQDALAAAVTFDRHPLEVLRPGTRLPLIAGLDERLDQMEAQGIDVAVVARVTPEFLSQEPEEFVREVLGRRLGAVEVLASENFRFGRGARGDLELLRALGPECGFRVTAVEPVLEGGERISSSRVAACVEAGRVADAARLLGRPYSLPGEVVRGEQLGRKLGFPTANIVVEPDRLLPADGVYVIRAQWDGGPVVVQPSRLPRAQPSRSASIRAGDQSVPGAANLGVRPTTDGRKRLLEVHLLDWEGDLYGRRVTVEFLERLRDEQRFPDLEALRAQIARDVQTARAHFGRGTATNPEHLP